MTWIFSVVLFTEHGRACAWRSVLCGQNVRRWSEAMEYSGSCLWCICLACMQWLAHTEVWIFCVSDWLVNWQDLYCWHNRSWGCKFFSIWQSKLDLYSSAKILSLVTFMPLRYVTECAAIKGRCAWWLRHIGWLVYFDIAEGHAFCIFRVTELDSYGVKWLGKGNNRR